MELLPLVNTFPCSVRTTVITCCLPERQLAWGLLSAFPGSGSSLCLALVTATLRTAKPGRGEERGRRKEREQRGKREKGSQGKGEERRKERR